MTTTAPKTRELPIVFSTPMVQAILAREKTMTRRVVKPTPVRGPMLSVNGNWYDTGGIDPGKPMKCPYGVPGDRLWVREKFHRGENGVHFADEFDGSVRVCFMSPRFLKRSDARIALEVMAVRVERLWSITETDVLAEGIGKQYLEKNREWYHKDDVVGVTFSESWDKINGKHPGCEWRDNPLVWVVSFKVLNGVA